VIGDQCLHAVGYAMGVQRDGGDGAVICYFGDGATSQGDVNEAFVFSAVYERAGRVLLPEQPVGHQRAARASSRRIPLYQRAQRLRLPRRAGRRQRRARGARGHERGARRRAATAGPDAVEAFTYRMGAHTTSDDPTRYRVAAEVEVWKLRDPIARLKAYLTSSLKADRAYFDSVDAESDELAATVRQGCLAMPDPEPLTMFDNIYVDDRTR
jgi:2-oxoisovalerate dehydrogenase E1 component alpha subunit